MSTRTGFPRMDWDTGFLADPKFQHLRDLLPDPIHFGYAGFCYLRLVADAWRTCQRRPIRDVVRGIEPWALTALREASLLEEDLVLSEVSFQKWIGEALGRRQTHAENVSKGRSLTRSDDHSPTVTVSNDISRDGRVGLVGKETTGERVQREGGWRNAEADAVIEDLQHAEYESSKLADFPLSDLLPRPK